MPCRSYSSSAIYFGPLLNTFGAAIMDMLLNRITQHAINYAIRSGITITTGYALHHTGRLLNRVEAPEDRQQLQKLQDKLQSKIRIIAPAIDMIELISARGNTTLESAVELTGILRHDIQSIAARLETANDDHAVQPGKTRRSKADLQKDVKTIINDLKKLLEQIEDAVPFLNLAITASGAKISSNLPSTISPSRLLQASTFLTTSDSRFALQPTATQVGPTFTLSLYMLFLAHGHLQSEDDVRKSTWKEVMHKARLKLLRVPLQSLGDLSASDASNRDGSGTAEEFAYQLHVIEDLDDARVHSFDDDDDLQPGPFEDVAQAGIREVVPVHELSKIFYADTGKILNIGGEDDIHRPVLLLKRDLNAQPPRRMTDENALWRQEPHHAASTPVTPEQAKQKGTDTQSHWHIPRDLDPEWLAFEVYEGEQEVDSDNEDEEDMDEQKSPGRNKKASRESADSDMSSRMRAMDLGSRGQSTAPSSANPFPQIRTSLSLLEVLLRLTSLQQFQQMSHLSIEDEFLNFFLTEASSTGAATGGEHERRRLREDAKRRVGFDPYDESPIKRRGEDYQHRGGTSQAGLMDSRNTPDFGQPSSEDLILPSIEDSPNQKTPAAATGVITPRGSGRLISDYPPLGYRSPSSQLTSDRFSPASEGRACGKSSPMVARQSKVMKATSSAQSGPLARKSTPADD